MALLIMNACKKQESPEFHEGAYLFTGYASYTFDSVEYQSTHSDSYMDSMQILLTDFNNETFDFLRREINSMGKIVDTWLSLEVVQDSVFGSFSPAADDFSVAGAVDLEGSVKMITGTMSYLVHHEYLVHDGPYTYPAEAWVTATGPFKIQPKVP